MQVIDYAWEFISHKLSIHVYAATGQEPFTLWNVMANIFEQVFLDLGCGVLRRQNTGSQPRLQ
jgi:hypothetical protein